MVDRRLRSERSNAQQDWRTRTRHAIRSLGRIRRQWDALASPEHAMWSPRRHGKGMCNQNVCTSWFSVVQLDLAHQNKERKRDLYQRHHRERFIYIIRLCCTHSNLHLLQSLPLQSLLQLLRHISLIDREVKEKISQPFALTPLPKYHNLCPPHFCPS